MCFIVSFSQIRAAIICPPLSISSQAVIFGTRILPFWISRCASVCLCVCMCLCVCVYEKQPSCIAKVSVPLHCGENNLKVDVVLDRLLTRRYWHTVWLHAQNLPLQVEINISWERLDTSKPKPWNMLKQEHGLIRYCTVSTVSASTIHTSLTLQKEEDKVCRQETKYFYTK